MTGFFAPGRYTGTKGGLPVKSVSYLDELLLTNFVLAALFLTAAGLLCATVCTGVRLCTGAALAAVSALVLLAPELPGGVANTADKKSKSDTISRTFGLSGVRLIHVVLIYKKLKSLKGGNFYK